ncbi:putative C2H2 transcription factor Crz1 [Aspergillus undulatus]|uniref:putative C2H2 transcription factor Crz1 n=1 Tax=Aspergillus undulatus TaxID=1810928 RepID=UPI003CCE2C19
MDPQDQLQDLGQAPAAALKRSNSPSAHPHQQQYNNNNDLTIDPSITTNPSYHPSSFSNDPTSGSDAFAYSSSGYLNPATAADANFNRPSLQIPQTFDQGLSQQPAEENFSNLLNSNNGEFDFSLYQNTNPSTTGSDYPSSLLLDPQQSTNQAVNPVDLVSQIPSPHPSNSSQTSPLDQQPSHSSPSAMSPPASSPGTFYTPQHSRHTSLDPASAAYMTNVSHPEWQAVMNNSAFHSHRRAPSEVSEVSSAAHSPFLAQHDTFDVADNNPSPLLGAQNDPSLYDNTALGIESFTLSEHHQHPQQGFSPHHSPYISPQLMPQQPPDMIPSGPFISAPTTGSPYPTPPTEGFPNVQEDMSAQQNQYTDIGQASQMAAPTINVEFAPPAKTQVFPSDKSTADMDSLSPPPSLRASRMRSKSDPYTIPVSRPRSPSSPSANLDPLAASSPRSLSPFDVNRQPYSNPSSREASPARSARRLSTSSIDSRNYILGLADPQRPGSNVTDSKRVQKHPATFQCHLCPKRFTRAYNLRSHLRTHTDERPFVCTVCGKAFARQHDRKRHEGLHSGEKKFVCRGDLSRSGNWGCGRRFARADALGRHFRSEAGRICIKPLLDEESQERERILMNQQQQHLQPMTQPFMVPGQGVEGQQTGNFILPAALLAQYPALQTLQWDQIPAGNDDASDIGGRTSFDASSGGEFGYDDDESGISVSGMSGYASDQGNMYGVNQGQMAGYPDANWGK